MTTFFDNQIDLFDLDSAGPEPAETTSADPKQQLIVIRRLLIKLNSYFSNLKNYSLDITKIQLCCFQLS